MNDIPAPLTSDQVDELLSAELDGELDAAARELGLETAEARARLDALPGVDDRRRALAAARDALGETPELDEITAARLRARAIDTAREAAPRKTTERSHRALVRAGSIAAAIVLVAGIAFAVFRNSGGTSTKESVAAAPTLTPRSLAGAANSTVARSAPNLQSLGDFAGVDALAEHVRSGLSTSRKALADSTAAYAATPAARSACAAATGSLNPDLRLTDTGSASVAGKPVYVRVYSRSDEQVVLVLSSDCHLLDVRTFPAPRG